MKENHGKEKKIHRKDILWEVLYYLSIFTIMIGVLCGQQTTSAPRVINGYSIFHVLTSSMETEIPKGSLVITKSVDTTTLEPGDDITYMVDTTTSITHRIVGLVEDYQGTGELAFETKGIANKQKDLAPVLSCNIVGKVIYHNYYLGKGIGFITSYWYLILIYLMLYLVIKNGIIKLFERRDKKLEETKKSEQHRSETNKRIYEEETERIYQELLEHYNTGGDNYDH